jgi:hypothetical protein
VTTWCWSTSRANIFSFGAVLYEMLSGTRAFAGHTVAHVLSAVMRDNPPPLLGARRSRADGSALLVKEPGRSVPDDAGGEGVLCSEIDAAADWYEKAIQERDPFVVVFARISYGKVLRESPRWPKLAKMMNLPVGAERP